jgi:hypothetical protein
MSETPVEQKALSVIEQARSFSVTNPADYEAAAAFRKEVLRPMMKEVDASYDPVIEAAHKTHKAALESKRKVYAPLEAADKSLDRMMGAYALKQRQEAEAEQRRLLAEARRREEDQRLAQAAALEMAGMKKEADAVLDAPASAISAPVVAANVPKVAGLGVRELWKYRIIDRSKINPEWMIPDEVAIGAVVRQLKAAAAEVVGGIEVYLEAGTVVR